MSGLFVLLALGDLGYWLSERSRNARLGVRRNGGRSTQHGPAAPAAFAQLRGEAGEAAVFVELRRVLTRLCGNNFHLHDGAVLIQHAPGTAFPTAEIDHLAVTPFGIFVIETKNWSGSITPGIYRDEVVRTSADGASEVRRSPIAQNRTKVAFLRQATARLANRWSGGVRVARMQPAPRSSVAADSHQRARALDAPATP